MALREADDAETVRMIENDLVVPFMSVDIRDVVRRVRSILRGNGTRRGGHLAFPFIFFGKVSNQKENKNKSQIESRVRSCRSLAPLMRPARDVTICRATI